MTRSICFVSFILALSLTVVDARGAGRPDWFQKLTIEQAMQKARAGRKIVLINFYDPGNIFHAMMDAQTFNDAAVAAAIKERTIAIEFDGTKEPALAKRFKIESYSTVLLLKSDGSEADRIDLFLPGGKFLAVLNSALPPAPAGNAKAPPGAALKLDALTRAKEVLEQTDPNDPCLKIRYARALAAKSKNADALEQYLSALDRGWDSQDFRPQRNNILLPEIARFGKSYPPAKAALEQRCTASRAAILAGKAHREIHDFLALCQVLGKPQEVIALWDELKAKGDAGADMRLDVYILARKQLLAARRYQDLSEQIASRSYPDVFSKAISELQSHIETGNVTFKDDAMGKAYVEQSRKSLIEDMTFYYEILLGTGQADAAKALHAKVTAAAGSEAMTSALAAAAARTKAVPPAGS